MIKTNCELPNCMLDRNIELNDYDFVLFHLYLLNPTYKEYYRQIRKEHPTRMMILDCSAYEFYVHKCEVPIDRYRRVIRELQPNYYIIPDVLMDKDTTLKNYRDWKPMEVGEPMVVAQGMTSRDLIECLNEYISTGQKNVCIPFHNAFYKEYGKDEIRNRFRARYGVLTDDLRYAAGRVQFIWDNAELLSKFSRVHLLGSHCPYEKHFYSDYDFTMDTGFPVKCGIAGKDLFTTDKPNIIIDEFINDELSEGVQVQITNNINQFKAL